MDEPQRIGLTTQANAYLDEMLDSLNSEVTGHSLIKFDLYRLAVALGVKKGIRPEPLSEKTDTAFRVAELDPDKALFLQLMQQYYPRWANQFIILSSVLGIRVFGVFMMLIVKIWASYPGISYWLNYV